MPGDGDGRRWPSGLRRTQTRERVLAVLDVADRPLTVYEIQTAVDEDGAAPVWLSTLYRTLERFVEVDLVVRTPLPDGGQAVYERNKHGHRHYAFCIGCSKMVAVERCPVVPDTARLADSGFRITGHKLEVYGYCADCARKLDEADSGGDEKGPL